MSWQAGPRATPRLCFVCSGHLKHWAYFHKSHRPSSRILPPANVFAGMFLTANGHGSVHQLSVGGGVYEGWSVLGDSIKTRATAFDQVHGHSVWEFYRRNPEAGAIFNEAMR